MSGTHLYPSSLNKSPHWSELLTDYFPFNDLLLTNLHVLLHLRKERQKHFNHQIWGWLCSFGFTPDISFGFANIWLIHMWPAGSKKVRTLGFIQGLLSEEGGEKQSAAAAPQGLCGLQLVRSQKTDGFWLEAHQHTPGHPDLWTTQNQQQHHYLMTLREAVRSRFTQKPHIWDFISPQLAASQSWKPNITQRNHKRD